MEHETEISVTKSFGNSEQVPLPKAKGDMAAGTPFEDRSSERSTSRTNAASGFSRGRYVVSDRHRCADKRGAEASRQNCRARSRVDAIETFGCEITPTIRIGRGVQGSFVLHFRHGKERSMLRVHSWERVLLARLTGVSRTHRPYRRRRDHRHRDGRRSLCIPMCPTQSRPFLHRNRRQRQGADENIRKDS